MTSDEFRALALGIAGASEGSHMGHADFRIQGKVFATLGYPDASCGMVRLPREAQAQALESHSKILTPAKGSWGANGSTIVDLPRAHRRMLRPLMTRAAEQAAPPAKKKPRA